MRPSATIVAALLMAAIVTTPAATTIAASRQHRSHASTPAPRHHTVTPAQPPARIACTVLGCQPILAACTPVPGRTWSGLPTGYDVVVCPPGGSPGR
jgi:hypothetical protein